MNKLQTDRGVGSPERANFSFESIVETSKYKPWLNWLSWSCFPWVLLPVTELWLFYETVNMSSHIFIAQTEDQGCGGSYCLSGSLMKQRPLFVVFSRNAWNATWATYFALSSMSLYSLYPQSVWLPLNTSFMPIYELFKLRKATSRGNSLPAAP